jgi:probable HAF family extracellular repeat protein
MRRQTSRASLVLVALATCAGIAEHTTAAPVAYQVVDLGTPFTPELSINSSGQVAGTLVGSSNVPHAYSYDGTIHDLGSLGAVSYGHGINDSGLVTGTTSTSTGQLHAFLHDGVMHDLGTLPGGSYSEGYGINGSGHVTGDSNTSTGDTHAFLYDGTMHDLGTFPGGRRSEGRAINNSGQVTGWGFTDLVAPSFMPEEHAFLYDGTMHDLGTLGGANSYGNGINDSGQVVGFSSYTTGNFATHAFLYDGTMHDLGTLPGGTSSTASDINSDGNVTGLSDNGDGQSHAFLYKSGSGMIDLNSLIDPLSGWELVQGFAINDSGQIAGWGYLDGEGHSFLLTPAPEPSSLVLGSAGLVCLVVAAHLRRPRGRFVRYDAGSSRTTSSSLASCRGGAANGNQDDIDRSMVGVPSSLRLPSTRD